MGLADYTAILRPVSGMRIARQDVVAFLEAKEFSAIAPTNVTGGALLASPPIDEIAFVKEHTDYILEALVKLTPDRMAIRCVSVRFAICQPERATEAWSDSVCSLIGSLGLQVYLEDSDEPDAPGAFVSMARAQIKAKKQQWRALFDGDTDEIVTSVERAWRHYLKRHQQLVAS